MGKKQELDRLLDRAEKALTPFANAVFNDNGDLTIDTSSPKSEDMTRAYFVLRDIRLSRRSSSDEAEVVGETAEIAMTQPMPDDMGLVERLRVEAALKRDCNVCDGDGIKESGRPCGGCDQTGSVLVHRGRVGEMMSEAAAAIERLDHECQTSMATIASERARAEAAEAKIERLLAERDEARAEVEEYDALFELTHAAGMRAVDRWRLAHPGNDLVLPDTTDLNYWLIARVEAMAAALKPFAEFAPYVEMFVSGRAAFGGSPILPTKHFRKADFDRARQALQDSKP